HARGRDHHAGRAGVLSRAKVDRRPRELRGRARPRSLRRPTPPRRAVGGGQRGRGVSDAGVHVIGLISDTHGLLRADVHTAFVGVELILHAGDVGGSEILRELELIAPTRAVYGNTDPPGDPELVERVDITIGGVTIHVSHGHEVGSPTPAKLLERYDADVIVYGHTHKQLIVNAENRWVVNPGAAGARRFDLLPSVARMVIRDGSVAIELIDLAP